MPVPQYYYLKFEYGVKFTFRSSIFFHRPVNQQLVMIAYMKTTVSYGRRWTSLFARNDVLNEVVEKANADYEESRKKL